MFDTLLDCFNVELLEMKIVDLSLAGPGNFSHDRSIGTRALWHLCETLILANRLITSTAVRRSLLVVFGARVGRGCSLKHSIRVKAPWKLEIGANTWLGESVWISNHASVHIGSNVCLSQGVFITSGSHDISNDMSLRVSDVTIEDGVWVCSFAIVQKGVTIGQSAVVTPGSVVHKSIGPGMVAAGNPAKAIRHRFLDGSA